MMNNTENFAYVFYLTTLLGMICYNAYAHNFQLLALWVLVSTQGLALGGAIAEWRNKK